MPTVTFAVNRRVKVYPKVNESLYRDVWWQPIDYQRFRQSCMATLEREASRTSIICSDNYCTRGLENWPSDKFKIRRQLIQKSKLAVLHAQAEQRKAGLVDPEGIAIAFQGFSKDCHEDAHVQGLKDQQEVLERPRKRNLTPARKRRLASVDGHSRERLRMFRSRLAHSQIEI